MNKYTIYFELNGSKYKFSGIPATSESKAIDNVLNRLKPKLIAKKEVSESCFENKTFEQLKNIMNIK